MLPLRPVLEIQHNKNALSILFFNFYTVKTVFLLMFRGIFNTGLTVFPDLSSIHSDDPYFIL